MWTWIRGGHVRDVHDVRVLDLAKSFPSHIVTAATNNSSIGILGKSSLLVQLNEHTVNKHDFCVANDISSEIILGLDW